MLAPRTSDPARGRRPSPPTRWNERAPWPILSPRIPPMPAVALHRAIGRDEGARLSLRQCIAESRRRDPGLPRAGGRAAANRAEALANPTRCSLGLQETGDRGA